jgi:integrase
MIYKKQGSKYYYAKFYWQGQLIHKSTKAADKKTARTIEGKMRAELARGNWGIFERKAAPVLSQFIEKEFLPHVDATAKVNTAHYYHDGAKRLLASDIATMPLDQITDQQAGQFVAYWSNLSPSTINCGLRTLRRALHLAFDWGKVDKIPKISLAKGERQRDRVLSDDEAMRYLAACPQPWKDCATLLLGTAMRPIEAFRLRWENVLMNGNSGLVQIAEGKTKAARRMLPMIPSVFEALKARHEAQGKPETGWVFPSGSASGHVEESSTKKWHAKALAALAKAHSDDSKANPEVKPFEPYCLRHTTLTRLAESGCDAFTLARIAGHSSIQITMRYCHPQADAIEQAFAKVSRTQKLVTDGGHSK